MNLFKTLASVGGMTTISRILGFIRDSIIARIFGVGVETDAFFVAFKIPNLFRRISAEGAFTQAFVPILAEYKTDNKIPANLALELVCVEAIIAIKHDDVTHRVDLVDKDDKPQVALKSLDVDRDYKIESEAKNDINNSPKSENINEVSNSDDEKNKIEPEAVH